MISAALRETDFTLKDTQNLKQTKIGDKSSNMIGTWARPTCWSWRREMVHIGDRHWWWIYQGAFTYISSCGG